MTDHTHWTQARQFLKLPASCDEQFPDGETSPELSGDNLPKVSRLGRKQTSPVPAADPPQSRLKTQIQRRKVGTAVTPAVSRTALTQPESERRIKPSYLNNQPTKPGANIQEMAIWVKESNKSEVFPASLCRLACVMRSLNPTALPSVCCVPISVYQNKVIFCSLHIQLKNKNS